MTNNIKVIFDNSDLHIQENITPSNIKVFFGVEDKKPTIPCDNNWTELEGNEVDLSCACVEPWIDLDGDNVNLDLDCSDKENLCDFKWKYIDPADGYDFNCKCKTPWDDTNDFNINCSNEDTTILGRFAVSTGEHVRFDISGLEMYYASSGESASAELDIRHTVLDPEILEIGERVDFVLHRERELSFDVLDGQLLKPEIKFSPIAYLQSDTSIGEGVDVVLNNTDSLDAEFNEVCQAVDAVLSTYPIITLDFNVVEGQLLQIDNLSVISTLISDTSIGENVTFAFELPYNPNIEISYQVGENVDTVLNTESILTPHNINHGEGASFTLSTSFALYVNTYEIGEDVEATLYESQNHTFSVKYDIGEKINDLELSTTTGFSLNLCEGQCTNFDLAYDPYTGFPMDAYAGEALSISLYRNRTLYPEMITTGESVVASLNTYPYQSLEASFATGEDASFKLLSDVRLGEFYFATGETANLSELNELDNYVVEVGESVDFKLATDTVLAFDVEAGEACDFILKTGDPSYHKFNVEIGEALEADIKTLRSYNFSVEFKTGERLYPDDWIHEPFHIDLDDRTCCDIVLGDLRNVEMDLAPYNHTRYEQTFKMCEIVTFELSSRRALSFEASSGEHFAYNNELNTLSFTVTDGSRLVVPNFRTIQTIDLDDGNQNPENPVIDIDRPEIPSDLKYTMFGSGEAVKGTLSASYALRTPTCSSGELMKVEMLFSPPFRATIPVGEHIELVLNTNIQVPMRHAIGESMSVRFYEPPYVASSGEEMYCDLETKSDYYAEFVTEGCLNNDYQDIDPESGQPLPQEYNGTSVEGEMFSKYIVGRCF